MDDFWNEPPFFATYQRLGVHVMAGNLTLLRAASRKLTKRARRRRDHRTGRRLFYQAMLAHHARERKLFIHVTHGNV